MIAAIASRLVPLLRWWPLALALALAAFAAGWQVSGWRRDARYATELQQAIDARAEQERLAQQASAALEEELAAVQKSNRALNRRLAHETTDPAYSCRVPLSGVRLLQDAVSGNPPGEPDGPVP